MEKCFLCDKWATHVYHTQFAGEHFYCKKHAFSRAKDEYDEEPEDYPRYISRKKKQELIEAEQRAVQARKVLAMVKEHEAIEEFINWFNTNKPNSGIDPVWLYNTWQEYLNASK